MVITTLHVVLQVEALLSVRILKSSLMLVCL